MDISQRITAIRKEMKLSQEKFGELVNMSQRSVAAWESGDRLPSYSVLSELADKLNVSTDYLLGRTDIKKEPAIDDDRLRDKTVARIKALPEPVLEKLLDLMDAVQSYQAADSAPSAAPGSSDQPAEE